MRAVNIIINPFKMTDILECTINKCVNDHMTANISGYLPDQEILERLDPDEEVSVEIKDEKQDYHCIFRGILSSLLCCEEGGLTKLDIKAKSKTVLLDSVNRTRFFYNQGQTYKNIVNYIASCDDKVDVICINESDQKCDIICQYRESDWSFLKRVAGRLNTVVIPDCTNSRICFYYGLPKKRLGDIEVISYEVHFKNDIQEYVIESRDVLDLCVPINFKGAELYIYEIESKLTGSELIQKYHLRTKDKFQGQFKENERLIGASIMGTVLEVNQQNIRVDCDYRCDVNGKKMVWFPYATVYSSPGGTGWYCMPEKGDRIRLYFPDAWESNVYAVNAVHLSCENNMRKNPEEKSMRTKYDKEIRFTPEQILITNHKGLSITLDDNKGIIIKSNHNVRIEANDGIEIESGGEASIVSGRGIMFKENSNSLTISDGIRHTGLTIEYQ